ncbi:hypothetical protein GWI33_008367 [Rhynchophorus ferrugineus]|uniref:Uncharacterized protein n=1 Tax=Rhynchophorus ferrugineus TaxID=354439 RepID=A0A834MKR9_RHYFE|nr:hypothetical protein GWI33_008367 [Rhynchophorus ferrugineus]
MGIPTGARRFKGSVSIEVVSGRHLSWGVSICLRVPISVVPYVSCFVMQRYSCLDVMHDGFLWLSSIRLISWDNFDHVMLMGSILRDIPPCTCQAPVE